MHLIYKYVQLFSSIYLEYSFHFYIRFEYQTLFQSLYFQTKQLFSLLNKTQWILILILNMNYFCFIVIIATVVQLLTSESNLKHIIDIKNPLTNNCNIMLDITKRVCQLN